MKLSTAEGFLYLSNYIKIIVKKVLIRASGLRPPKPGSYRSGIPRSNIELLKAIIKQNDPDLEIAIYCPSFRNPLYFCQDWPIEHYWYGLPGLTYRCKLEPWWRQHIMGRHDLTHLTENADYFGKREKFVVTIHDTDMMNRGAFYEKLFLSCAAKASGIVTCSEFSKKDIITKLNVDENKVTVVPWGISKEMFYPHSESDVKNVKTKFGISGDYFFSCSCKDPRKNLDIILESFSIFAQEEFSTTLVLALSNPKQEYVEKYKNLIYDGRIKFINFVSDEDLATLYTGALASILVSSLEGFGFPILESMACGTNCITCKNSSMTEIGGDKAIFVKERDSEDLARAFSEVARNGKENAEGLIQYARQFTWAETTKKYLDFYKRYL